MPDYFIKYQPEQKDAPYRLPENLNAQLGSITGLSLLNESSYQPIVTIRIPQEQLDNLRSLEGILEIYELAGLQDFEE